MRYLCLVYAEESKVDAMSQAEVDAFLDEVDANAEEMRARGQLVRAEALEHVAGAKTVRVRDGRLSATDGPFAETTEQLGGFFLIDARDMDEAIAIAGTDPRSAHREHRGAPRHRPPTRTLARRLLASGLRQARHR